MELEKRHHQRKLEIKEKIDNYENTKSCMKQAVMYSNQVVTNCSWVEQQHLGSIVKDRLNSLLDQLIRQPVELQTSLEWESNKEVFSLAIQENFGKFSSPEMILRLRL